MKDTIGFTTRLNEIARKWQEGELSPDGYWDEDYNFYVTGEGQVVTHLHAKSPRCDDGCVIHAPSDHDMREWPTHWRYDRYFMERICEHGIGHPDPDDMDYRVTLLGDEEAAHWFVHGCDGCCDGSQINGVNRWEDEGGPIYDRDPGDES